MPGHDCDVQRGDGGVTPLQAGLELDALPADFRRIFSDMVHLDGIQPTEVDRRLSLSLATVAAYLVTDRIVRQALAAALSERTHPVDPAAPVPAAARDRSEAAKYFWAVGIPGVPGGIERGPVGRIFRSRIPQMAPSPVPFFVQVICQQYFLADNLLGTRAVELANVDQGYLSSLHRPHDPTGRAIP
jgi:hypothetical protein